MARKRSAKAKFDFTENQLPSNRKEVFVDCLKINKGVLIKIGFRLLLFSLPLVLSYMLMNISASSLYEQYLSGNVEIEAIHSTVNAFNLINILLWGIVGIGCGGSFRVVRGLIWQEPIFINSDFSDGIKLNWKPFLAIFSVIGFVIFAIMAVELQPELQYLLIFISAIILLPVLIIMMGLYNVYNITSAEAVYNSLTIYIKNLFYNLLMAIAVSVIFALLIASGVLKYLLVPLFILLVAPLLMVAIHLYLCYLFDIHINKLSYPEYVDKGIHRRK